MGAAVAAEMRDLARSSRPLRLARLTPESVALAHGDMRAALRLAGLIGREIDARHEYTAALAADALRGDTAALAEFRDMAESDGGTGALARAVLDLADMLARLASDGSTRSRAALFLVAATFARAAASRVAPRGPVDLPPDPWHRDILTAATPTNGPNTPALTCAPSGHAWAAAA